MFSEVPPPERGGARNALGVQWLKLQASTASGLRFPLVRELKSCRPCGAVKKKKGKVELESELRSLGQYSLCFCVDVKVRGGTSLMIHWLRLRASTAKGTSSIPDRETNIPHVTWQGH